VSYFIKIKQDGPLRVPGGFDYRPVNPADPGSISLRGRDMSAAIALMDAAGVLDRDAVHKPQRRRKKPAAGGKRPPLRRRRPCPARCRCTSS
jgi:hypothetical protein